MCAVRRTESVVHVNVCQSSQLLCKAFVALFLFRMETQVFQQQHFARFEIRSGFFSSFSYAVFCELDWNAQHIGHVFYDVAQGILILYLAVRTAQMRHQYHAASVGKYLFDSRNHRLYARIVRDVEIFVERDVEIHAHDSLLAVEIEIVDSFHMIFILMFLHNMYGVRKTRAVKCKVSQ